MFHYIALLPGWAGLFGVLIVGIFQLWMFIDAVRKGEWMWAVFIWLFPMLNAVLYYFFVYRSGPSSARGFELPGAAKRQRIKELQAKIHHLDNAVHHFQLGDIYFRQGKFAPAEQSYRAALERDPKDIDARAELAEVVADDAHAPTFQRRRDRVWVSRARSLMRKANSAK